MFQFCIASSLAFLLIVFAALKVRVTVYAEGIAPLGHLAIGAVSFGLGLACVLWAHSSFVRLP